MKNEPIEHEAMAVDVSGLVKAFGGNRVLRGLDLRVGKGVSLAVLGPNGAGKTTLIKLLAGIMRPTSGKIRINGYELGSKTQKVLPKIGLVSHKSYLYGNLSAWENLDFYGRMYGVAKRKERIAEVLEMVGLFSRRFDRFSTFSRGMQQRMALARALLHDPSILFLDEPETGLDQQGMAAIWEILRRGGARSRSLVFSTHSFERALSVGDEIAILSGGRIVFQEATSNLELLELQQKYGELTRASSQ